MFPCDCARPNDSNSHLFSHSIGFYQAEAGSSASMPRFIIDCTGRNQLRFDGGSDGIRSMAISKHCFTNPGSFRVDGFADAAYVGSEQKADLQTSCDPASN
jgi:hypothetical protein